MDNTVVISRTTNRTTNRTFNHQSEKVCGFDVKSNFANVFEFYLSNLVCTDLLVLSGEYLGFDNSDFFDEVSNAKPDDNGNYHIMGNSLSEFEYKSLFFRLPNSSNKAGILSFDGLLFFEKLYENNKLRRDGEIKGFTKNYYILKEQLSVVDADYRRYLTCLSNMSFICLEDCKKFYQFFFDDLEEIACDLDYIEIYYLHAGKILHDVKTVSAGNYIIGKVRLTNKVFAYVDENEKLMYSAPGDYKFEIGWFVLNKDNGEIFKLS